MTRTGKIARLPRAIREEINERLLDGVPGKEIVESINALGWMRKQGRTPITEQNLSEWRKGGYQDWLRHRENMQWMQQLREEAEDLHEAAQDLPVADRMAPAIALGFGKLLADLLAEPPSTLEERAQLLAMMREFNLMRTSDQRAALLRLKVEAHYRDLEKQDHEDADQRTRELLWRPINDVNEARLRSTAADLACSGLPLEVLNRVREASALPPRKTPVCNPADPSESDRIQADPTSTPASAA